MQLFDNFERSDPSPCRDLEDSYAFLNRVDTPFWEEVRDLLEEWFSRYPVREGKGLRKAFRSRLPGQHYGAWWELYLHELFSRLGYEIEIHPGLADSSKKPDFLLRRDDSLLYVEAAVVFSGIATKRDRNPPRWLLDAINHASNPDFFVRLVRVEPGEPRQLKRKEIVAPLESWLSSLAHEEVSASYKNDEGLPEETIYCRGWEMVFEAWPVKPEARGKTGRRLLGIGPAQTGFVNDIRQLRSTLKKKAGRFGRPKIPMVTAILSLSGFMEQLDIEQALFGDEAFQVPGDGEKAAVLRRQRNGFWTASDGPQNQRVSAVLTAVGLHPANVNKVSPSLWLNPWADYPLEEPWPFSRFTASERGEIAGEKEHPDMAALFDLPADWPGSDPFPRE